MLIGIQLGNGWRGCGGGIGWWLLLSPTVCYLKLLVDGGVSVHVGAVVLVDVGACDVYFCLCIQTN